LKKTLFVKDVATNVIGDLTLAVVLEL